MLVVSARVVDLEIPLSVTAIATVVFRELLATAKNWAVVDPDSTVTDGGMTTAVLLLLSVTVVGDVAGPVNVTVQALEEAPESDVGVQANALSVGVAGDTVRLAVFGIPASVAVNITETLTTPLLLAENWTLVEPLDIVTDCGTVTAVLLLLRVTAVGELAAPLNVAVQMLDADPESDVGLQISDVRVGVDVPVEGTVTAPPLPESATALPAPDAASVFITLSAAFWEAVTLIVAITPSAMVVAFRPYAMQVPVPELQINDFPTAVNTGPAVAEMELIPAAGYWKVHCRAEIEFAPDVNVRLRDALPVAVAVADERLRLCAWSEYAAKANRHTPAKTGDRRFFT